MLLPVNFAIEGIPPSLTTRNLLGFAWLGSRHRHRLCVVVSRLKNLKASTVAFLGLLSPISALLLDFLLLKKSLSIVQFGEAVLVLGSILISQLSAAEDNHQWSKNTLGSRGE